MPTLLKDQAWAFDEGLQAVTVETRVCKSDFSFYLFFFFLSCSLLTTDKLRLAKNSLNKPEQGVPNTSGSISRPSLQPGFLDQSQVQAHILYLQNGGKNTTAFVVRRQMCSTIRIVSWLSVGSGSRSLVWIWAPSLPIYVTLSK